LSNCPAKRPCDLGDALLLFDQPARVEEPDRAETPGSDGGGNNHAIWNVMEGDLRRNIGKRLL
jgi:hypothetical protein